MMDENRPTPSAADGASGFSRLLAVVDDRGDSLAVGERAVRLAKDLGAELFVLGVFDTHGTLRARARYAAAVSELERECAALVQRVERPAEESGVRYSSEVLGNRHPGQTITARAKEVRADCIVVGSPGTSVVDRLLAGTRREVLRRAGRPVLIV